jgi:hypothetical protein
MDAKPREGIAFKISLEKLKGTVCCFCCGKRVNAGTGNGVRFDANNLSLDI